MGSRYCNPYSGNEKGSVENAVGFIRRNLLIPVPAVGSLAELNDLLRDGCDRLNAASRARDGRPTPEALAEDLAAMLALPSSPFDAWHHQSTAFTSLTNVSPRWLRRTVLSCEFTPPSIMDQTSQNSAVLHLKDRPPPGIAVWESLERSHARNSSSLVAVSSHLTVVNAPQTVHLHRWDPDEVLPLRLVRPPQ